MGSLVALESPAILGNDGLTCLGIVLVPQDEGVTENRIGAINPNGCFAWFGLWAVAAQRHDPDMPERGPWGARKRSFEVSCHGQ